MKRSRGDLHAREELVPWPYSLVGRILLENNIDWISERVVTHQFAQLHLGLGSMPR